MKNDFKPVVGHSFNLRARLGRASTARSWRSSRTRRCLTWVRLSPRERRHLNSTPTSGGTRLRMEQSGFRPDQQQYYQGAQTGWQRFFANLSRSWRRPTEAP